MNSYRVPLLIDGGRGRGELAGTMVGFAKCAALLLLFAASLVLDSQVKQAQCTVVLDVENGQSSSQTEADHRILNGENCPCPFDRLNFLMNPATFFNLVCMAVA